MAEEKRDAGLPAMDPPQAADGAAATGTTTAGTTTQATVPETKENGQSASPSEDSHEAPPTKTEQTIGPKTKAQIAVIMGALCMSVFLAALDITIITTALPTISGHFHSSSGYTWIGSAYLLGAAASTPSWGKFSDIFGRKPIILTASVVFFLGSALCGFATSIKMIIAGRAVQGIGGGGLIVLVQICVSDLFSMRERGLYFGLIGMTWALASGIGPILGGVLTQRASWRWCFWINLPVTGTAFFILMFFLKLKTPKTPLVAGLRAIDWLGSLAIIGGTLMFLLGLEFGGVTHPWNSATVICLIVFGLLVASFFVLIEWKIASNPVMPLRIFGNQSNIAALLVCLSHGLVFIAGSYFLPLYFQAVLGATPILSGVYLLPFALTLSFASAATGVFIRKTGRYLEPIRFGLATMTLGFGLFINLDAQSSWAKIILYQMVAGLGVGPNFQAPLLALQSLIHPRDIGTATSTYGTTRNLAMAVSVVVGGVIFQNQMQKHSTQLVQAVGPQTARLLGGGAAGANVAVVDDLPGPQREIVRDAFASSLSKIWILYVVLGFLGVVASFFISKQKLDKQRYEAQTGLAAEAERREAGKAKKVQETKEVNEEV